MKHYGNGTWKVGPTLPAPIESFKVWRAERAARRAQDKPASARAPRTPGRHLGRARTLALWAAAVVILAANGSAFAESYRGLLDWANRHGMYGFWGDAWPLQVDSFIVIGELVLFLAAVEGWRFRHRLGAWAASLIGLVVSVAGNSGSIGNASPADHITHAIPPVAGFAGLAFGVFIVKRVLEAVEQVAEVVQAVEAAEETPAEALEFVAPVQVNGASGGSTSAEQAPAEVPADAEHAARIAFRATHAAGNPLSANQLQERFGVSRAKAKAIREEHTAAA